MSEISDNLLEAIDIIARARDIQLPYDKTLSCQIVDNSNAQNYEYLVSYEGAEFNARTERTDLEIGDYVYVKIVNNDPAAERLIIGKKMIELQPTPRALEYENFIKVTPNLNINYGNVIDQNTITVNGKEREKLIFSYINPDDFYAGYTRMGLKLAMNSRIDGAYSGTYGLRVHLTCIDQSASSGLGKNFQLTSDFSSKDFYLNLEDLIGVNYYNSLGYCNQSKIFDITNLLIKGISIYLFQKNDFADIEGNLLDEIETNIIQTDLVSIAFGYHSSEFTNHNLLYLYTRDGLRYNTDNADRTLYVRWVDDDGVEYEPDDSLTLYIYDPTRATINEKLNEWYYEEVDGFTQTLNALTTIENQRFKASIYLKGRYLKSNTVIFQNTRYNSSAETLDLITGLTVDFGKTENNGVYYIYGQDNLLLNQGEANRTHYMRVHYSSLTSGRYITKGDVITWRISIADSMIEKPRESDGEISVGTDYYTVRHIVEEGEISVPENENEVPFFAIPFRIKDFFSSQNTKNTIYITYEFTNEGIENKIEINQQLLFGFSGSQGADYIFTLTLVDDKENRVPSLVKNINGIKIKPSLYDYNQKEISIDKSKINYSWFYGNNECLDFDAIKGFSFKENWNFETATKNILQAEIEYAGTTLTTYLPIPIRDSLVSQMDGASTVTYEITGKKPQYYKAPFVLSTSSSTIYWGEHKQDNKNGYPVLKDQCLMPASIYQNDLGTYTIYASKINGSTAIKDLLWIQPILITQNRYPSAMLNKESNELTFNNKKNIIEMTMVGRVNTQDTNLSGLFMGILHDTETLKSTFGLYGYSNNKQVFCLDETGKLVLQNADIIASSLSAPSATIPKLLGDVEATGAITAKRFNGKATSAGSADNAKSADKATTADNYSTTGSIQTKFNDLVAQISSLQKQINDIKSQI